MSFVIFILGSRFAVVLKIFFFLHCRWKVVFSAYSFRMWQNQGWEAGAVNGWEPRGQILRSNQELVVHWHPLIGTVLFRWVDLGQILCTVHCIRFYFTYLSKKITSRSLSFFSSSFSSFYRMLLFIRSVNFVFIDKH